MVNIKSNGCHLRSFFSLVSLLQIFCNQTVQCGFQNIWNGCKTGSWILKHQMFNMLYTQVMLLWKCSNELHTFSVQYVHLSCYVYSFWVSCYCIFNTWPKVFYILDISHIYIMIILYTVLMYRPLKISPILIETALGYEKCSEDAQPIIYPWGKYF